MSEQQDSTPRFIAVRSRVFDHGKDQYCQCDNAVTAQLAASQMNGTIGTDLAYPWTGFTS
jgi:hypothetical protein